jgi:SAM-dependent methyltransferase
VSGVTGALVGAASAYYRGAGRFAWHFARGKLRGDPAYETILRQGLLARRQHLLDLGAGQGLLAAWLLAARAAYAAERAWPQGWPAPPELRSYTGIEINPQEVRRARRAFALDPGAAVQIVHGDIRNVDYGSPDAVVILDVLHYNDCASQERILKRVRAALAPGGTLLLRVGDADGGLSFGLSKSFDRTVALLRRSRWLQLHCRALREWQELLERCAFEAQPVPMQHGATFSNTLLLARAR